MKPTALLFFFTLSILKIGYSQKLTYTRPSYISEYSKEIVRVEQHQELIQGFDTTTISGEYQITSEPTQIRNFSNGKLVAFKNKNTQGEYKFNENGNIESLVYTRNNNITIHEYYLDQEKLKLEVYKNKKLKVEVYFDSQHRRVCNIQHHTSSRTISFSKEIYTYEGDLLIKKEYYKDDKIQQYRDYTYENGKLKYLNIFDQDGFHIKKEDTSYFPTRTETIITTYYKPRNSYVTNPVSPISKRIEFFDEQDSLIKSYKLSFRGEVCTAIINEYRLYR